MEQSMGGDGYTNITNDNGDEDIVVDTLDNDRDTKNFDKEFVLPGGQIIGLDQAVLMSIERCRKFYFNFFFVFLFKFIFKFFSK